VTDPVLSYQRISVEFDPAAIGTPEIFTFTKDGAPLPDKMIEVPHGIGMIMFELSTKPPVDNPPTFPTGVFQTYPIQWMEAERAPNVGANSGVPASPPEMFIVQKIGDTLLTLVDFNSNQSDDPFDKNHWFNLVILYMGQTYGSDPVIVNMPPDGGFQTARVQEVIEESEVSISLRKAGSPRKRSNQGR
jgi:hypothetical protein